MLVLLLFLGIVWIVTAAGRQIALWLRQPEEASLLERGVFALGLGLGLLAYGMLVLGLAGLLSPVPTCVWLLTLALVGGHRHVPMARALTQRFRAGFHPTLGGGAAIVLLLVFAVASLSGVYTPPTPLEWDSLAYHLADPKLYLQAHQIYYLPWESHSNFAFTAEMWYTLGLMLGGVPLAKLFHFACAAGTCLTLYVFGRRHLDARIGLVATLIFAATPLVFWEAGTAYADLATAFFATLTLLTVANLLSAPARTAWLPLSAVLMGLTLSTKATALSLLVLLGLGLLVGMGVTQKRGWGVSIRKTGAWLMLALLVGSPWYIKSAVYTGNPIYPFYFQIFGGRYWNAVSAGAYDQSNADFGQGHAPDKLLLAPWNLTMSLTPNRPLPVRAQAPLKQSFNDRQSWVMLLLPLGLAALFFPAFGLCFPEKSRLVLQALGAYALGSGLLWFATAQHVRYLLPTLPVLCLLTAGVLVQTMRDRWHAGYALAALGGFSLLLSLWIAVQLLAVQTPVALGRQSRASYASANDPTFPAMQFINTRLPMEAKLVFYGNPLGFYCDRHYLWGEALHSAYIPYAQFRTAGDLNRWFHAHGITHVLVNSQYFGLSPGSDWPGWVYQLTAGSGPPIFSQHGVQVYALPPAK